MTNEEVMQMLTDMGLHEGGIDNWVVDNAWYLLANKVQEKEREVVANWIMDIGFATGHGDSIVDLLDQLEWQIAEKEREACAKLLERTDLGGLKSDVWLQNYTATILDGYAKAIRARGQA